MKLLKNITRNIHLLRSNRPATPGNDRDLPNKSSTILSENSHHGPNGSDTPRVGTGLPADHAETKQRRPDGAAARETPSLPADFSPQGYRDRNPEVRDLSDHEIRRHYGTIGKVSGLAYRPDQVAGFDPDHFRETHPAFAHADDAACQAAWQAQGGPEGDPGHQAAHLGRLGLSLRAYPAAFPWRFYTRLYPRTAAHRWAALAHFLREGFAETGDRLPTARTRRRS
ncbi:hypothetical protein [Methylobacterium frigidaeris]|uniref:Uncharacterized protein n=1 Tax=Methylobacterium frigidaeris TaxID=2038277 RepID=A0AA37H801_9HYPH|nr:hypothetical protein [Methylobacterium frigidaeris]GJD60531.1 hypothetical protein MPEAHAMD_0669 [Methylobacterium frigidaeris]